MLPVAWLRVTDPRGRTRLEALERDRSVLGRSASCDIAVDDPDVGLRHVSVLRTERGYLIVAESDSLPIWKEEERVTNTFLEDGADYRIGSTTIRFLERTTEGMAPEDLGSAPTVMGEAEPLLAPRGKTLMGPPTPDRTPSSSPTMPATTESSDDDSDDDSGDSDDDSDDDSDADEPIGSSKTQLQGSGNAAEHGDSTRTVSPGPPVPSSTPTLPGEGEAASKTEVARPRPRPAGTTPPWKTQAPPPRTGRTVVPSSSPSPPALQLVPHKRTAPPTPRPNPEGSTPTEPPTQPPPSRAQRRDPMAPMLDPAPSAPASDPESAITTEPVELEGLIEAADDFEDVELPADPDADDASEPIELRDDAPTVPRADAAEVPPVRFPPPSGDGIKSTSSWVWRKGDDSSRGSRDSVYSLGKPEGEVHRSSESWGWTEGAEGARPEGRAQLEPEVELPPGGPVQGLEAPMRPSASPPVPPPPPPSFEPAARVESPPPPPAPEPPPEPRPRERPRVEPVLLPVRRHDEPPLPQVSKELSSGHSWMWALPQSLRDGPNAARRSRGGDPLVVAGVVLVVIGMGLIGIAFLFGLTTDVIAQTLGGGA